MVGILRDTPSGVSRPRKRPAAGTLSGSKIAPLSPLKLAILLLIALIMASEVAATAEAVRVLQDDEGDGGDQLDEKGNEILEGADTGDSGGPGEEQAGGDGAPPGEDLAPATGEPPKAVEADQAALEDIKKKHHRTETNVHKDNLNDFEVADLQERYAKGTYRLIIESITPRGGPTYGTTRVVVRMDNLEPFIDAYPDPKCKFGKNSMVVEAAYVKCTKRPIGFYERERGSDAAAQDSTCIQCEQAPKADGPDIVSFTVSLTGKFDDAESSMPYRFYNPTKVHSIYPRYGPKDGDTVVQVWGENFLDLGDDFRCNFGTKSTKAHFISSEYLWCRAPQSDVVERPMPFSISMNRQQNSLQRHAYWYYNMQSLFALGMDYGPITGGQKLLLKGQGFLPFDWKMDIDNQNDTFCSFGPLGKTPAHVLSSTQAECLTPPNRMGLMRVPIKLALNNQNYTDEDVYFTFFNPPNVIDAEPLIGPVKGGTVVNFWGNKFEHKNVTCRFGSITVKGVYVSKEHLQCTAPLVLQPGDIKLTIKYDKDRFESDVLTYTYFANPEVVSLDPACGPVEGYTQIKVLGKNFVEQQFGKATCVYNNTIFMNATVIDSNTIICDSPPLESASGDMWYNVSVSLDGDFISNAGAVFRYYHNPRIDSITPWLGPMSGGTQSVIRGWGFNQTNVCRLTVRYEQTHISPGDVTATSLTAISPPANISVAVVVSVSGNDQQFINDLTLHYRDRQNTFEYYQAFVVESVSP